MNHTQRTAFSSSAGDWPALRRALRKLAIAASAVGLLFQVGCSSDKGETEPTVSVQVAPVEKTEISQTITAQAVLFARQQAAIVAKISAPVQKFLVKRGAKVHQGQLLAVLENRDLSAAAQEIKAPTIKPRQPTRLRRLPPCPRKFRKPKPMPNKPRRLSTPRRKFMRAASNSSNKGLCLVRN